MPISLISSFCSSGQMFAASFLQIPSHDGHPCSWLYTSRYRACYGLAPLRECSCWANIKKRSPRHCRRLLFSLFNNRRYNCYTSVISRFGRNFSRPTVYCFFNVGNAPVSSYCHSEPALCKASFMASLAPDQLLSVTIVVPPVPTWSSPMPCS